MSTAGAASQVRSDTVSQFALPPPAQGFRATSRPPIAPMPTLMPAAATVTSAVPRAPAANIRPPSQPEVVPATQAQGFEENYAIQNRQQQQ